MKMQKVSCQDALNFVRKSRPCAYPNSGFLSQLKMYQNELAEQSEDIELNTEEKQDSEIKTPETDE